VLDEYRQPYKNGRPNQSKGNVPLPEADLPEPPILPFPKKFECDQKLGGLIKHSRRATEFAERINPRDFQAQVHALWKNLASAGLPATS